MSHATWPSDLPSTPLVDGYSILQNSGAGRIDMESGRARQQRFFPYDAMSVSVSWVMSDDQLDTFRSWLEYEAQFGAVYFSGLNLAIDIGLVQGDARFDPTRPIQYSYFGPASWRVVAVLEITNPAYFTPVTPEIIIGDGEVAVLGSDMLGGALL